MRYVFDIDGVICSTDEYHQYDKARPDYEVINSINNLYDNGENIVLFTARGESSGINWSELTKQQLKELGIRYHKLINEGKPGYDYYIDDKAINVNDWKKRISRKVGFVASSFDLLHTGHCLMLKDAKEYCDWLIAALQVDPTIDRPNKNKPVQTIEERFIVVSSIKYIDEIVIYTTEAELKELLKKIKPDIRILGSDWQDKQDKITGIEYSKEIYFHKRDHEWSTSELRRRVKNAQE